MQFLFFVQKNRKTPFYGTFYNFIYTKTPYKIVIYID